MLVKIRILKEWGGFPVGTVRDFDIIKAEPLKEQGILEYVKGRAQKTVLVETAEAPKPAGIETATIPPVVIEKPKKDKKSNRRGLVL